MATHIGRFTKDRKDVLDKICLRLRLRDRTGKRYVPIIFDFKTDRDYTEVVTVWAGISRFIIADLTSPKSIPQKLQPIIGGFQIPLIPIIHRPDRITISKLISKSSGPGNNKSETEPYSVFADFLKYEWVHPVIGYSSEDNLFQNLEKLIYEAEEFHERIMTNRKRKIEIISIDDL